MNTTSFPDYGATVPAASRTKPFAPLTKRDLHPLRQRAMIQTSMQQQAQVVLADGVDQQSEAMMCALGLVSDSALPHLAQGLTPLARQRLGDDLQHLAADLLMTYFPRQDDGRFPLGATVLLETYFPRARGGRCGWWQMRLANAEIDRSSPSRWPPSSG